MKSWILASLSLLASVLASGPTEAQSPGLDPATAERFAQLALECVGREYPNKISHVLNSDADAKPPKELTPIFYGCYDWHSAVHGHWLLVRLARTQPKGNFAAPAMEVLERGFSDDLIAAEVAYLEGEGRVSFERPYGLAWLLQLAAELREWDNERAQWYAFTLGPLERTAADRIRDWLPKLTEPIRVGEHSQTAFALGLVWDWAVAAQDTAMQQLIKERIEDFYLADRDCPLAYEPSGQDFLSPCLAEADLVRRLMDPTTFAAWLGAFLPQIPFNGSDTWLEPGLVIDPTDPKLAHLDGLNLSRAWMLEGIASGLPPEDPRLPSLEATARRHRDVGLRAVTGEYYVGGHWLGSFATYLVTGRGLPPQEDKKTNKN
ncbi:MAG: DUF2891 domain-containing protein [Acidobacteriota bacterium]